MALSLGVFTCLDTKVSSNLSESCPDNLSKSSI